MFCSTICIFPPWMLLSVFMSRSLTTQLANTQVPSPFCQQQHTHPTRAQQENDSCWSYLSVLCLHTSTGDKAPPSCHHDASARSAGQRFTWRLAFRARHEAWSRVTAASSGVDVHRCNNAKKLLCAAGSTTSTTPRLGFARRRNLPKSVCPK